MDLLISMKGLGNEVFSFELSGKKIVTGTIIEACNEIIVLFTGRDYVYIPVAHIQNYKVNNNKEDEVNAPLIPPSIIPDEATVELSLQNVIEQAKGMFVELGVTGSQTMYGWITHIMDDYIVFQSPLFGNTFISITHIKWLIPFSEHEQLYGLDNHDITVLTTTQTFEKRFVEQLKSLSNKFVVLDMGKSQHQLGRIKNVDDQIVEIQNARNHSIFFNISHIKIVQQK